MANPGVGWSDDDLAMSVRQYVGSGYNQDAPDFAQFCHALAKILRRRRTTHPESLRAGPAIFVMGPVPVVEVAPTSHPMFDRARDEPAGRIWFGARRLAAASALPLPTLEDADLFAHVVDTLGLGSTPTVFYDAVDDAAVMRLYKNGMGAPDDCEILSLDGSAITLDYVRNVLDTLHQELLETPSASESQRELWEKQGKWFPINESEKGIQKILYIALKSHLLFSSLKVKQEDSSRLGRCDIILLEQDPVDASQWTHHAILELKVIKSFSHTGSGVPDSVNRTAVSDGLDQARDYRDAHACRLAALCCYDMRKKPDPIQAIAHEIARAQTESVGLWAWAVYNKAKAARMRRRGKGRPARPTRA